MGNVEEKPTLAFTDRDLDVLADLGSYRFMSVPQLAALHFPSEASGQARMRRLTEAGLAIKVFMPVRPYDRTAHTIYALGAKGAALVAERRGGERPRHLSERERRSGLFLDHTLRRNDLRVVLELLDRTQSGPQLLVWRQAKEEVGDAVEVKIGRWRKERVPLIPDGFFALRYVGQCHAFVVEIDMGTVRLERMKLRYRAYWQWWREGRARARFGDAPLRVLTLTTTATRLESLRRAAAQAPGQGTVGSNLFWFASLDVADLHEPRKLLGPVWTTATRGPATPRTLFDK